MTNPLLLQNVEQYVRQLFTSRIEESFSYHSIGHTEAVVKAALTMADYYKLSEEDRTALVLAAWFHDTGYSKGKAHDHETASQRHATNFLASKNVESSIVNKVVGCIAATRMPQSPKNLLEEILCDADLQHLGSDAFPEQHKLLRKELISLTGEDISKKDWRKKNISFLEQHQYFTEYGKTFLEPVKKDHLDSLVAKQNSKTQAPEQLAVPVLPTIQEQVPPVQNAEAIESPKKIKEKESRTERGIATMFRIMSENHVNLSQMADSKANIMISVNTIVLSILVSVLFSKLQYYPQFIVPTIILCTVSLLAIVFAILATRPNINKGTFNPEDVKEKKINLLFFGNFFKMELPDYEWAMKEMMNDRDYLYGSMIKDIYFLGKVLAKKYKFLRLSYNIFMFGLVIAIVAFVVAFVVSAE
ncbi:MAG: phosphohydrolase [Chitinophagaceae bacterium]|nr:phosphohydrolase [Chitinophagaceae bacterium]